MSVVSQHLHNSAKMSQLDLMPQFVGPKSARRDEVLHRAIRTVTESSFFNSFIMFIICMNALFMAFETEDAFQSASWAKAFTVLDYTFLAIYTVEFILKVYAEPIMYWRNAYNVFDFIILVTSVAQVILSWARLGQSQLKALRVLRALRSLRTLRTVSFIKGLQVLVIALLDTIRKWVINILMLLLLLMFLFAIMGYYFFGYQDERADKQNWGTLGAAMLTLFSYVTVDGWTALQDNLDQLDFGNAGRLYSILFIFLGHFIFTNVFIGVIIMNISEATEQHKREERAEREAILRHKKEFMLMRQHNDVKMLMERQKRGKYSNFSEMANEFQSDLRHDDLMLMNNLCTNLVWMETFTHSTERMDSVLCRYQQLHFEMANLLASHIERKLKKQYGI